MPPPVAAVPLEGAPPVPAPAAPGLAELAAGALELTDGLAAVELDELEVALELLVVVAVVGVVDVAVLVVTGAAATVEVGIVSGGASAVSGVGWALEPQPASAKPAITAMGMRRDPPRAMGK